MSPIQNEVRETKYEDFTNVELPTYPQTAAPAQRYNLYGAKPQDTEANSHNPFSPQRTGATNKPTTTPQYTTEGVEIDFFRPKKSNTWKYLLATIILAILLTLAVITLSVKLVLSENKAKKLQENSPQNFTITAVSTFSSLSIATHNLTNTFSHDETRDADEGCDNDRNQYNAASHENGHAHGDTKYHDHENSRRSGGNYL